MAVTLMDIILILVVIVLLLVAITLMGNVVVKIGNFMAENFETDTTPMNDNDVVAKITKLKREQKMEMEERKNWKPRKDRYYVNKDSKLWNKDK